MRLSLNILWVGLLLAGLAASARPAVRRAGRILDIWTAPFQWARCKESPVDAGKGDPVAWLTVPSANISTMVVGGIDKKQLSRRPGQEKLGKATLIMAHRDTHFQGLKDISPGNPVQLELRDGSRQTYKITDTIIVEASRAESILHETRNRNCLILLTCYPFRYIGPAPSRILFIADPV